MSVYGLPASGVLTSPNYPGNYPNKVLKNYRIQVEQGLQLILHFTAFATESSSECKYDHLNITDGDGTTLMGKACGTSLPTDITSVSSTVDLVFRADRSNTAKGWRVSWRAVRAGVSFQKWKNQGPQIGEVF